jgi:hypothetical protein
MLLSEWLCIAPYLIFLSSAGHGLLVMMKGKNGPELAGGMILLKGASTGADLMPQQSADCRHPCKYCGAQAHVHQQQQDS